MAFTRNEANRPQEKSECNRPGLQLQLLFYPTHVLVFTCIAYSIHHSSLQ